MCRSWLTGRTCSPAACSLLCLSSLWLWSCLKYQVGGLQSSPVSFSIKCLGDESSLCLKWQKTVATLESSLSFTTFLQVMLKKQLWCAAVIGWRGDSSFSQHHPPPFYRYPLLCRAEPCHRRLVFGVSSLPARKMGSDNSSAGAIRKWKHDAGRLS